MHKIVKTTDSQSSIVAAIELNRAAYELALLGQLPGAQIVHRQEITYVATGLYDPALNKICRTQTTQEGIKNLVEDTHTYFKQDEVPYQWLVGPASRPLKIHTVLEDYGLVHDYDEVCMVVDLAHVEAAHDNLVVVNRCLEPQEVNDASFVQRMLTESQAQHLVWERMAHVDWYSLKMLELYVAYRNDEPVATVVACMYAGVVGLYAVGTVPQEREKGYATALVSHVLNIMKGRGYSVAIACAPTPYARFYQRLGFKAQAQYQVWSMHNYRQQYEYSR